MQDEIEVVTLTESDLFRLSEFVDELVETSERFKDDGILLFNVANGSGEGTSLEEFFKNYRDGLVDSLKRINPIHVPQSKEFYAHMAFSSTVLDQEDVESCVRVFDTPSEFLVSPTNCCMSAMNENGVVGLLSHYFDEVIPAHASYPPRFLRFESRSKLDKKAATKKRTFNKTKRKVDSLTSVADKAAEMSRILDSPKQMKEEEASIHGCCSCWMCVSSDEVLVEEEDGLTLKPDLQETANYYRGKGFMYASGVNVKAEKRNRVSANFSLSFLNHLTFTSLLGGFFPGINNPYLYFGFIHSFFPIHIEDLSLWSVNFLHHGFPKLWIVVPPSSVAKLQYFLSREFTCPGHGSCYGLLGHKYHVPTPFWLKKNGIPFKVVVQQRGQGIIVAPNAAHMGFNLGPNVAEAINFASRYWIPFGIVYPKCTCMVGQVHADLSTIIRAFSPDMLPAYLHQKIPTTKSQAHFNKCIVFPHLWKEAFESAGSADVDCQPLSGSEEDGATVKRDVTGKINVNENVVLLPVQPKRLKKCPNRKDLICPVCNTSYSGGQKQRLFDHFEAAHSQLPDDERSTMKGLLKAMFPEWGTKLPKKTCNRCGKAVARSMNKHQQSSACKVPEQI